MMGRRQRHHQRGQRVVSGRTRQRGVAVITALLLTALAITIVASLFWQQQVQVRSMENQRLHLQTRWILRGAQDFSRLLLREDGRMAGNITALDGIWATPLGETNLEDYVERGHQDGESYNATLQGAITDAQARYNLTNLALAKVVDKTQVAIFQRLLNSVQLDPSLAQTVAQAVANSQQLVTATTGSGSDTSGSGSGSGSGSTSGTSGSASSSNGSEPMPLMQLDDVLSVAGFTPDMVRRLSDYATVLPTPTLLNVNTASPQAIAAVLNVSVSEASTMVAARKQAHFLSVATAVLVLNKTGLVVDQIDVKSNYFLLQSRIRLDRAALDAETLIQRLSNNLITTTVVSMREN